MSNAKIDILGMSAYNHQLAFQRLLYDGVVDADLLPMDNVEIFKHHTTHMMSELGEVLQADQRWKAFHASDYNASHKQKELADVFLVWCNLCIFSGYTTDEIFKTIFDKIEENTNRIGM